MLGGPETAPVSHSLISAIKKITQWYLFYIFVSRIKFHSKKVWAIEEGSLGWRFESQRVHFSFYVQVTETRTRRLCGLLLSNSRVSEDKKPSTAFQSGIYFVLKHHICLFQLLEKLSFTSFDHKIGT